MILQKKKKSSLYIIIAIIIVFSAYVLISKNINKDETQETIKIGATFPLTGSFAYLGVQEKQGVELAVEEINKNGGINNKKLVVIFEDNEGDAKKAATSAQKLINQDKIVAMITAFTHITASVSPITAANNILLIYNSTITSFAESNKYVFQDYNNMERDGKALAEEFIKRNISTVSFIQVQNDAYTVFYNSFKKHFEFAGGKIENYEQFLMTETNFSTILTKVKTKSTNKNIIIGSGFPQHVIPIFQQMKTLKMNDWQTGVPVGAFPETTSAVPDMLESTKTITTWFSFDKNNEQEGGGFINNFKEVYKTDPEFSAAYTYDQTHVLAQGLEYCDKKNIINADCLSDFLINMPIYNGVAGTLDFDNNGVSYRPTKLLEFKNNKWEKIN